MGGERRGGSQRSQQDAGQHDGRAVPCRVSRRPEAQGARAGLRQGRVTQQFGKKTIE